jgi:hypoxanthine phosphoribosyltransferase
MLKDIQEVLVTNEEIKEKVKELAKKISDDYNGKDLILIGVLKGGFVFLADLMRELSIPVQIDFVVVSSYGNNTVSLGAVKIIKDTDIDIADKHVLIIEDLIDTGLTLKYLKKLFLTRNPLSVKICTALDKPSRRKTDIAIDYEGIVIPDKFVVGYGLDFAEKYRQLRDVCVLRPECY